MADYQGQVKINKKLRRYQRGKKHSTYKGITTRLTEIFCSTLIREDNGALSSKYWREVCPHTVSFPAKLQPDEK